MEVKTGRAIAMETARRGMPLRETAEIETANDAFALIELDSERRVWLGANTRVEIPGISWDSGELPFLILKRGSFRWRQLQKAKYNIRLQSDLFDFVPPVSDFLISVDPKKATAEIKVISGQVDFSAMNAEDSVLVTAGHKVSFTGVIEEGEVAYDVLLKGRKIPRGKLGPVIPFDEKERKEFSEQALKVFGAQEERRRKIVSGDLEELKPDQICRNPPGKLNECVWRCMGQKSAGPCRTNEAGISCVRSRCNANGQWADDAPLGTVEGRARCWAKRPVVGKCDY
ncbi:MAG: hypothetical protein N2578_01620 [Bdellovibrionaceae bacterium]|nr:hypothetical protein [Pseudobdellovibrionaceae bacterium]